MTYLPRILLLSASLLGFSAAAAQAASFRADVNTLNNSGASGTVFIDLSDDKKTLTVTTNATGLEPNQNHVQHIHGLFSSAGEIADSMTPTLAQDTDGDGFVELAEGGPVYGPIILPLETINTPDGNASITTVFDLTDPSIFGSSRTTGEPFTAADLMPLTFREIVIHGKTVAPGIGAGTPGEVDGTGGYLAVLPVAAGEIVAVNDDAASVPEPGTTVALIGMGAVGVLMLRRQRSLVNS